jgi:hypothetical protein
MSLFAYIRRLTGRPRTAALALAAVMVPLAAVPGHARAVAIGPAAGPPWIVSVGDSYISGEAGRWAGNTNASPTRVDAGGPTAYFDAGSREEIPGCHRSGDSEVHFRALGAPSPRVLACSGATTSTVPFAPGTDFKPGLDFYDDLSGHQGQARMLETFATSHNVQAVAVSIGGNDFHFGEVVKTCVRDYLTSFSRPTHCSSDPAVLSHFTPTNVATQTAAIVAALRNVQAAMSSAGYAPSSYTLFVQDYESPVPNGATFRYPEANFKERYRTGGCGFWSADADWANATALPTINQAVRTAVTTVAATSPLANVRFLELQSAFDGRRLCETGVRLLEDPPPLASWTSPGAVDSTEWIDQIRTVTTVTPRSPYFIQESLHPNYWAQRALANCLWQGYLGSRGGRCTIHGPGLTSTGDPDMTLI